LNNRLQKDRGKFFQSPFFARGHHVVTWLFFQNPAGQWSSHHCSRTSHDGGSGLGAQRLAKFPLMSAAGRCLERKATSRRGDAAGEERALKEFPSVLLQRLFKIHFRRPERRNPEPHRSEPPEWRLLRISQMVPKPESPCKVISDGRPVKSGDYGLAGAY